MKKAFTLTEVMITLTVIGIITSVIIPVAINSKPNENIMKFKKAHNTLYQTISTLITSDKYYLNGDLGMKPDGNLVDSATYLCETMADNLTTKKVNCSNIKQIDGGPNPYHLNLQWAKSGGKESDLYIDGICSSWTKAGEEIVLSDGVVIYQTSPGVHFGSFFCNEPIVDYSDAVSRNCYMRLFSNANTHALGTSDFDTVYKPICIDIDGINKGEDPFGYGIRADGNILVGKRAKDWLEKSIQN